MGTLFISHATADDAFVRALREQLGASGITCWVDSRELRGGDPLWPEIKTAIENAEAFAVVVSPESLQSGWVELELQHALKVRAERGPDAYRVVPLLLDGTKLGVMETFFGETPVYIEAKPDQAGVEAALSKLMEAIGQQLPTDRDTLPQPEATPLEELVLELSDLRILEQDGVRRPTANARLLYQPATPGMKDVHSELPERLTAPLGPIEAEELRWYLEKHAVWPSGHFKDRADRVEKNLITWGRMLHDAAMPTAHTNNVMKAWNKTERQADRRFSVKVDATTEAGATEEDVASAKEAATLLLGLPWELLHNGKRFLFQGASPTRVRRRLPGEDEFNAPLLDTPIRILLVTARPEDEACGYIDHRASALPLVETTEALGGLVDIHVLSPATLPALRDELDRAGKAGTPYHVVHFDGHGIYDKRLGLGGLCFEHPEDTDKLTRRRHETVHTDTLGPLLTGHRIPVVFLEACQTAMSEHVSESVASELLKVGVASVVAMSHSVLVETARRFVHSFYKTLAEGRRVGDAMLSGQRELKDNTFRARVFGLGELRLEDWFVPVLFQDKDDPQLFKATHPQHTQENVLKALEARMGALPPPPGTGFVGRSRDMLAIERLLHHKKYAVIRGQGGEGKTAIASELGRWMVRSRQVRRAAFVSVEINTNAAAVINALGPQLDSGFKAITAATIEEGIKVIERALREQATLLIVDNMESILTPPSLAVQTPEALAEEAQEELSEILAICKRLNEIGETKAIFTTREPLPAPFDAEANRRELVQLSKQDAVKLVERVINDDERATIERVGTTGLSDADRKRIQAASDAAIEEIEDLVDAVHRHARALANLAPSIKALGVTKTRASLINLMAEMERRFPGSREQSVYASVELSLRRMSVQNRKRAKVLGVFHGGVNPVLLMPMMGWSEEDVGLLATELVNTGLATPNRYNHLTLNPALCPYLHGRLVPAERDALTTKWAEAMRAYVQFLDQQRGQSAEVAATLTGLELPGLLALLEHVQQANDAEATIGLATSLYALLQALGKPRLLQRVGEARDDAAGTLGQTWSHAAFQAARTRIEQHLSSGRLQEAFMGAKDLLARAQAAGERAYQEADYDSATACILMGRVLQICGSPEQALSVLSEADDRFEALNKKQPSRAAARMASISVSERGDCLRDLGRLDDAARAYEEAIRRAEASSAERSAAVNKVQLGTVRLGQRRYQDALDAYTEARQSFTRLDEPGSVAIVWHQIGMAYQQAGQPEAAEDAYRQSLAIVVRLGYIAGQASTLMQLGSLYGNVLNRPEEAVAFYQQAADLCVQISDTANEGRTRSNLGNTLNTLRRYDEARREIRRAIDCKAQLGHAAEPWKTWAALANTESASGNPTAAADATAKARAAYLAHRRDGGENHLQSGRLALAVSQTLRAGEREQAAALFLQLAAGKDLADQPPFIQALQSIVAGTASPSLAEDPRLDWDQAAEITLLLESLQPPSGP